MLGHQAAIIIQNKSRPEFGDPSAVKCMCLKRPGCLLKSPTFHSTLSRSMQQVSSCGRARARLAGRMARSHKAAPRTRARSRRQSVTQIGKHPASLQHTQTRTGGTRSTPPGTTALVEHGTRQTGTRTTTRATDRRERSRHQRSRQTCRVG